MRKPPRAALGIGWLLVAAPPVWAQTEASGAAPPAPPPAVAQGAPAQDPAPEEEPEGPEGCRGLRAAGGHRGDPAAGVDGLRGRGLRRRRGRRHQLPVQRHPPARRLWRGHLRHRGQQPGRRGQHRRPGPVRERLPAPVGGHRRPAVVPAEQRQLRPALPGAAGADHGVHPGADPAPLRHRAGQPDPGLPGAGVRPGDAHLRQGVLRQRRQVRFGVRHRVPGQPGRRSAPA